MRIKKKNYQNSRSEMFEVMGKLGLPHPKIQITENENKIVENDMNNDFEERSGLSDEQIRQKVEDMKRVLDKLETEKDYQTLDALVGLLLGKKYRLGSKNVQEDHSPEHKRKIELMKGKLDFFFNQDHYDLIDKLDQIFNKIYDEKTPEDQDGLSENKK